MISAGDCERFRQISGKSPRDIRAAIWDSGFEDDADSGRYPDSEAYLTEFASRLGHPLQQGRVDRRAQVSMTPDASVLGLAARCAARARIVLFTNNGPLLKENLPEIFPGGKRASSEWIAIVLTNSA